MCSLLASDPLTDVNAPVPKGLRMVAMALTIVTYRVITTAVRLMDLTLKGFHQCRACGDVESSTRRV